MLYEVITGGETFQGLTETIVRQVGDIRRLVDEFSSFARMPTPQFARENLSLLVQQAAELQRGAYPTIAFAVELPGRPTMVECDRGLVAQCLTNILKNAIESIEERQKTRPEPRGAIQIAVRAVEEGIRVEIADNGTGLPSQGRERLTDPYVTNRTKGTGLGLAIVKKIMDRITSYNVCYTKLLRSSGPPYPYSVRRSPRYRGSLSYAMDSSKACPPGGQ